MMVLDKIKQFFREISPPKFSEEDRIEALKAVLNTDYRAIKSPERVDNDLA